MHNAMAGRTQHRQILVALVAEPRIGVVVDVQRFRPPVAPLAAIASAM
jgi:hypothetical protein